MRSKNNSFKQIAIFILAFSGLMVACSKYKDPKGPDLGLTNKYCNDPAAINYNHGFPGVPDNSVCVYAVDLLSGTWLYQDSLFFPDSTFYQARNYTLQISEDLSANDSMRNKLEVAGFCSNGQRLKITANRYGNALTDTLIEFVPGGQFFCQVGDTISGSFMRTLDTTTAALRIDLFERNASGQFYHRGIAVKQ